MHTYLLDFRQDYLYTYCMFRKRNIIILSILLIWCSLSLCPVNFSDAKNPGSGRLGVWVTVFTKENVTASEENIDKLVSVCKDTGINDIYLQVYRADKAYYDSRITDRTPYENMLKKCGTDPIDLLIKKAEKNDIKVHAWLNCLSIAQNKNANVITEFGDSILVVDQHGRTPFPDKKKDGLDKYYIRENQLFLNPSNENVREYIVSIAEEVIKRYPGLDGVHLDYIRYPAAVPFIPGSRFTSHGISYGYNPDSLISFKNSTGLDVKKMKYSRENYKMWDDWRRNQVTGLVRDISRKVKTLSPRAEISCTIVPSIERTYFTTLQDWTEWLKEGYVDTIIVMNYTDDSKLMKMNSEAILLPGLKDRIQMGVGAYLLENKPDTLKEQFAIVKEVSPAGMVIFSYDDISGNADIKRSLKKTFAPISPAQE